MMDVGGWHRPKRWAPARNQRDGTSQALIPSTHPPTHPTPPPTNTHMKTACYYIHRSGLGFGLFQPKQPFWLSPHTVQVIEWLAQFYISLLCDLLVLFICLFLLFIVYFNVFYCIFGIHLNLCYTLWPRDALEPLWFDHRKWNSPVTPSWPIQQFLFFLLPIGKRKLVGFVFCFVWIFSLKKRKTKTEWFLRVKIE